MISKRMVKVARLQSEFWREIYFLATNLLTKNAPKFSPKYLSLYYVDPPKSRKILATFPGKFPCEKSKKLHRRASAGAWGERMVLNRGARHHNITARARPLAAKTATRCILLGSPASCPRMREERTRMPDVAVSA